MNPTEIKPVYMLISSIVIFVYNLLIWLIIGKKIRVSESNYKARYVNMKTKHTHVHTYTYIYIYFSLVGISK